MAKTSVSPSTAWYQQSSPPYAAGAYINSARPSGGVIPAYYKPTQEQFISWDFPNVVHTGIDVDYKMTGYDFENRTLAWSVDSGPAGMTIDSDGTIHWMPVTDSTTEAVTIGLTFDGGSKITKIFTITVENSRCIFVSTTGNDSTGTGSLAAPYLTFTKAAEDIVAVSTGVTVFQRGGTYTIANFNWTTGDLSTLSAQSWSVTDPICIRNYPTEAPIVSITAGSGFVFYGDYVTMLWIDISGSTTLDRGGLVMRGTNVAKQVIARDADFDTGGNVTGFQLGGGVLLDSCTGYNNRDTTAPSTLHNQSNYLFYGSIGSVSEAFLIDCISDAIGFDGHVGFKVKHAGENVIYYHNCIDSGSPFPISVIQNKASIRHGMFYTNTANGVGVHMGYTDPTTGGENNTNEGMLIQGNVIVAGANARAAIENLVWALNTVEPLIIRDNNVESYVSGGGAIFTKGRYSGDTTPATWKLEYDENTMYSASPTNSVIITNSTTEDISILNGYGDGNTEIAAATYTKTVNGRTFQIVSGVMSEI